MDVAGSVAHTRVVGITGRNSVGPASGGFHAVEWLGYTER